MKKHQENKNRSYQEILNVANAPENKPVWENHEAFSEDITAMTLVTAAINTEAAIQKENLTGIAVDEEEMKLRLISFLINISGAVQAYARKQNDNELYRKMNFAPSVLKRRRNSGIAGTAQLVHDTAAGLGVLLTPFGITASVLTAFQLLITDYKDNYVTASKQAISNRKNITVNELPKLFKQADTILRDQLLKMIPQFNSVAPAFVAKFISATHIGQSGIRHTRLSATVTFTSDSSEPVPAKGVLIIIEDTGLSGNTDDRGKCTITKVPDGKHNVILVYNGTEQLFPNVTFIRGKATSLSASFPAQFDVPAAQQQQQFQKA